MPHSYTDRNIYLFLEHNKSLLVPLSGIAKSINVFINKLLGRLYIPEKYCN